MEFRFLCSTRSTSHSLAALTRELSSRTFEEKFHISTCTRVLFSISLFFSRLSVCFRSELRGIIKPLMTGPTGNNEFCYPKTRCFPRSQSLIAYWFPCIRRSWCWKRPRKRPNENEYPWKNSLRIRRLVYTPRWTTNFVHLDDKFLLTNRVWREKNTWFSLQVGNQEYKFFVHDNSLCSQSLWVRKLT